MSHKSKIMRDYAEKHGLKIIDVKLSNPDDMRGCPANLIHSMDAAHINAHGLHGIDQHAPSRKSLATREHMLSGAAPTSLQQIIDEIAFLVGPERDQDEPVNVQKARLLRWEAFIREFIHYNNERPHAPNCGCHYCT